MSGPVPSPSMKGMIGLSGTTSFPSTMRIVSPFGGAGILVSDISKPPERRILAAPGRRDKPEAGDLRRFTAPAGYADVA